MVGYRGVCQVLVYMTWTLVWAQYKDGGRLVRELSNRTDIMTSQSTYCENTYYNWPECIDTPKGYTCLCGPGFYWNTKICISDSVDSRLEFIAPVDSAAAPTSAETSSTVQKAAFAYTLLLNKPFPRLDNLTMSMYLKPSVTSQHSRQCIFSYKYNKQVGVLVLCLVGQTLELTIHNETVYADPVRDLSGVWSHLVITWYSFTGKVSIYINNIQLTLSGGNTQVSKGQPIESNGFMVLGQYSPNNDNSYNLSLAYVGSLAHVNIWKSGFLDNELETLFTDCTFTHCGDGVEWVDLREGTRGLSRLVWPSGIDKDGHCFTKSQALTTCDKYCSYVIGVQCKEEIRESVTWSRTPADTDEGTIAKVALPCPGYTKTDNSTDSIPMAVRLCTSVNDVGVWGLPQMDDCLSPFFLEFSTKVRSYKNSKSFDKSYVIAMLSQLSNHTRRWTYTNPVDLSVTIQSLSIIVNSQKFAMENFLEKKRKAKVVDYSEVTGSTRDLKYPDSIRIAKLYLSILNDITDVKHDIGWNKTRPRGQLADELLQLVDDVTCVITLSLHYHFISLHTAQRSLRVPQENVDIKLMVIDKSDFYGVIFPDASDVANLEVSEEPAVIRYNPDEQFYSELKDRETDYLLVSILRLSTFSRLLYDPRYGQNDNVNTPVVSLKLYESDNLKFLPTNITYTTKMKLYYSNANNFSNPECVAIVHGDDSQNKIWGRNNNDPPCNLMSNDSSSVTCECVGDSFFTATTDMFNEDWRIPEPPPLLMTAPSYVGCSISVAFCLLTLGLLTYVGTSSRTAIMHKHFTVAVACNTLVFMTGIRLTFNEGVCKAVAILFHYFFLSVYAWLMNEGFNVYISITYTAHNQSTQENSGHWRYYIIGWGVPGVLVSAIVGSTFDSYFSKDMCFVSWDSIWLFVGPPLAMICVTLLVMTFAAKENNEVSYTKNESANTMTQYHVNAVWTQLILVSCTWAIALLSLKYESLVFKWVFFIFNCAQGSFLLVFFFLLNEEVRSVFKSKEIKQQLGWDVSGPVISSSQEQGQQEETVPLTSEQGDTQHEIEENITTV